MSPIRSYPPRHGGAPLSPVRSFPTRLGGAPLSLPTDGAGFVRSVTMRVALTCAVALGVAGWSCPSLAANEARVDIGVMVPPVQRLEVVQPALVMPELTVEAIIPGYIMLPRAIELRISSNTDWALQMRVDERSEASAHPRIEIVRMGSEEPYQPISEDWLAIAHGGPGQEIAMELRVRVALEGARVNSGAYETRFDYRLSGTGH
jgi:hypothetical protein